jgi:hypothetical protein
MSAKKAIFIGCGTVAVMGFMLFAILAAVFIYVSQDVQDVSISITSPLDVEVGETFEMIINIKNEREQKALMVSAIDISDTYLAGFVIISTDPTPESTMHIPFDNSLSHAFETSVPAGATAEFAFTLRAEEAGIFRGDVDLCEGSRFTTTTAQTVVND